MPDFQRSVSVAVSVSVKNRVRTCRLCRCCWGLCAVIGRQALEAGRRVSRAKEWAELQARTNGRYGKIELDLIWTDQRQRRTYGNGERNFYVSYGVCTEFLRMNVILTYFATETATATDTERWKSGIIEETYRRTNRRTDVRMSSRVLTLE